MTFFATFKVKMKGLAPFVFFLGNLEPGSARVIWVMVRRFSGGVCA